MGAYFQEVMSYFSLKVLYLQMAWFATCGYLMYLFVVMALTRLPIHTLLVPVARLQALAIGCSYVGAPFFTVLFNFAQRFLGLHIQVWFVGQLVYALFTILSALFAAYFFCTVFVTIGCHRFRFWLMVTNVFVGLVGYFVLESLGLLQHIV